MTTEGATQERVWDLFADPRKLERWWGPPSHPATVVDHDLTPGGKVSLLSTLQSREQMEQLIEMGVIEGLQQSIGQMDALLAG